MPVEGIPSTCVDVLAGFQFSLAITRDGRVYWWGRCLTPDAEEDVQEPAVLPTGTHKVVSVSGGTNHVAMLTGEGVILTWGHNDKGQLGE